MNKNPESTLYFYQADTLITLKQGASCRSVLRIPGLPLAELKSADKAVVATMLSIDKLGSVLRSNTAQNTHTHCYDAYGHDATSMPTGVLGFNGERREPLTGSYFLGNGYRTYRTLLRRFSSPDSWSPFGDGGLNAYAYCAGDPVNKIDPTGHMNVPAAALKVPRAKLKLKLAAPTPEAVPANSGIASSRMLKGKKPDGSIIRLEVIEMFEGNRPGSRKIHVLESQREEYISKYALFSELNMKEIAPKKNKPLPLHTSAARDRLLKETRRITSLGEQAWLRAEAGSAARLSRGIRDSRN